MNNWRQKAMFLSLFFSVFACSSVICYAQISPPKVLIVIAHPDDETGVAATVYKITHELGGIVDLCLITNGEGGYKYSTLAEKYYGLELTDEKIGRENLPRIRKMELMNAGKIIGIRNFYFLDQKDTKYGLDEKDPLDTAWDINLVNVRLKQVMLENNYDFLFCVLPVPSTHAHHKAASILALRSVLQLNDYQRPIVLGFSSINKNDTLVQDFLQLKDYNETRIRDNAPPYVLDRTTKFGYKNMLDYKIIVNWEIAEHKSQGTMQLYMNQGDLEQFWYFNINNDLGLDKCRLLFDQLKNCPYPANSY